MNEDKYRSEEINLLMGSLAKAQGMYKPLVPNDESALGQFANLQAIIESVKEALASNGLSFFNQIELLDEGTGSSLLWTRLGHESGQFISTCARVIIGKTFRETFNGIECYKRLNALNLLGIAPVGRDPLLYDDNGSDEVQKEYIKNVRAGKPVARISHPDTISKQEYEDIMWELEGYPDLVKNIQKHYAISSIADLPKSEFYNTKAQIRKIKKAQEDYSSSAG